MRPCWRRDLRACSARRRARRCADDPHQGLLRSLQGTPPMWHYLMLDSLLQCLSGPLSHHYVRHRHHRADRQLHQDHQSCRTSAHELHQLSSVIR